MRARMSTRGLQEITFQRKILDNQELTGSLRYGSGHVSVSTADRSFELSVAETGSSARSPPRGFNGVLTRQEWKGVIDFAHAAGTRDAAGVWTPTQARQLFVYTKSSGGSIAAAEFMNEPTYAGRRAEGP
jgi:hypothetical protein